MDINSNKNEVEQKILDVAQELFQERGYKAFSYRDLSERVGIRRASIHYYFPSKSDLAKELTVSYRTNFSSLFTQIDTETDNPKRKLEMYLNFFINTFKKNKTICPCSMLAADIANLPKDVQSEIKNIFMDNEKWLAKILNEGLESGDFKFGGDAESKAQGIFATIEGAIISTYTFKDDKRLLDATEWIQSKLVK